MKKLLPLLLGGLLFIVSCEAEPPVADTLESLNKKAVVKKGKKETPSLPSHPQDNGAATEASPLMENIRDRFLQDDLSADCLPTGLAPVLLNYLDDLVSDPVADAHYATYVNLSRNISIMDPSPQYFGSKGEYTKLMEKRIRELERFWGLNNEIVVKGQHSESLRDREKLATYFYNITYGDRYWEDAYLMADHYLEINELSPLLPDSPLFSADGFTSYNNLIVIGDGLVQMLSETGIDPKIVWTGILAHEWSHQLQMAHSHSWYDEELPFASTSGLRLELEADFFAAYFLTHKRGATYNWKRVQQFLDLFFQSGDCAVGSPIHHGTPQQRMLAARLGYELAASAQKQGHILNPEQVHLAFEAVLPQILAQ